MPLSFDLHYSRELKTGFVNLYKEKVLTNFEKVKEFMDAFGQEVVTKPEWPNAKTMELRIDLIEEEVKDD